MSHYKSVSECSGEGETADWPEFRNHEVNTIRGKGGMFLGVNGVSVQWVVKEGRPEEWRVRDRNEGGWEGM